MNFVVYIKIKKIEMEVDLSKKNHAILISKAFLGN